MTNISNEQSHTFVTNISIAIVRHEQGHCLKHFFIIVPWQQIIAPGDNESSIQD